MDHHLICVKQHKIGTGNIPEDTTIHDRELEWETAAKIYIACHVDMLCHSHDMVMQADMTWETING